MNLRPLLALMVAASALAAADSQKVPTPRPRLTDNLRLRADEAFPATIAKDLAPASPEAAYALAPVRVTATYLPPLRKFEDEVPRSQPFTAKDGGTLWRHDAHRFTTELKFQYNPAHRGFDLLSFSW